MRAMVKRRSPGACFQAPGRGIRFLPGLPLMEHARSDVQESRDRYGVRNVAYESADQRHDEECKLGVVVLFADSGHGRHGDRDSAEAEARMADRDDSSVVVLSAGREGDEPHEQIDHQQLDEQDGEQRKRQATASW